MICDHIIIKRLFPMQRRANLISTLFKNARAASSLGPLAPAYHHEMRHTQAMQRELDARFYATETMPQWLAAHGERLPQTPAEWTAVIKKNPSYLRFVPDDMITQDLCLLAVNHGESRLEYVPEEFRTRELYMALVTKCGYLLKTIPEEHKDHQLCLAAIKAGANMADVPLVHQTRAVWHAAFEKSKFVIKQMPEEFMTAEICREGMIEDLENMQYIPAHLRTREIWLIYVSSDSSRLAELPKQYQTQDMYQDLMSKNPGVIKFIPHEYQTKEMWLTALRFNVIELGDVPYLYRFAAYDLLAGTKNLVVTNDSVFPVSEEDGLVAYTYANKESRTGKTVCASGNQLISVLKLLSRKGATDLNLVLVGHSALRSESIAGMRAIEIADLVVKFPMIKKVTLLGCMTADVKKVEAEIALVKAYQAKLAAAPEQPCGFILLSALPDATDYSTLLSKSKLDRTFVMIKDADQYSILYLEKNADGKIESLQRKLDEAEVYEIHACMTAGKKMAFPKNGNEKFILRSQSSPLSAPELEVLDAAKIGTKRLTKAHPEYKSDKASYPFLKSFSVTSWFDMSESLMKKLAMQIEHTHGISSPIKIKGYPKPVYADVDEKRLIVSKDELYTYKRKFTLFADNLDRRKVEESRKDAINRMKKAIVAGADTEAKSIEYETKPLLEKKTGWFF